MDISLQMLRENPAQYKIIAESQNLPFKAGCFSMITACSVFHYLPDPVKAIQELCRIAADYIHDLIEHSGNYNFIYVNNDVAIYIRE